MRNLSTLAIQRVPHPIHKAQGDDFNGAFYITIGAQRFFVIASNGAGWDHVSVSSRKRCPTWDEMQTIRHLFFWPHETVVQFSPPTDQHINVDPHTLHLWRWQHGRFPTPPLELV